MMLTSLFCCFSTEFILEDWLSRHYYPNTVPLSDFVVTMLVDELQIGSYLLEEQCTAGVEPFILKTGNWNKGLDTEYYKNPTFITIYQDIIH